MLKHIINIFFFTITIFSLSSCQKVIDVKVDDAASKVVIEGVISNISGRQTITISGSVPYTQSNTYPAITGASVTVTGDNGRSYTFVETKPGTYTYGPLKGEPGHTYTMKAVVNNITYTASSTMPAPVVLDSLGIKALSFGGADVKTVEVHYQDPADQVNQYRWVMKVNTVQTKVVYADNDRFTNGNNVANVLFYDEGNDNKKLESGDVISVEMQCIDKNVFNYWYTLSQQYQNGPGGGVTPGNPPSNIDHNALGYFSAQTSSSKAISLN